MRSRLSEIQDFIRSPGFATDNGAGYMAMLADLERFGSTPGRGEDVGAIKSWAGEIQSELGRRIKDMQDPAIRGFAMDMAEAAKAAATQRELDRLAAGKNFFDATGTRSNSLARVTNNIDARGARVNVNIDRVETDNPAMLARQSLTAGFTAVAKQPIRARTRPGSVGLANGD